jgi:hypothetical protein
MDTIRHISLSSFRGKQSSIFTGRPEGKTARTVLNLDHLDHEQDVKIIFDIPEGTTSFNPSFFLGLLFDSFKNLGIEGFHSKYAFAIQSLNEETRRVIEKNISDGTRNAINALNNKNALTVSLNG